MMINDILISTISWSFEGLITLLLFTAKKRKLKFHIFSSQYLEEKMKFVYKAQHTQRSFLTGFQILNKYLPFSCLCNEKQQRIFNKKKEIKRELKSIWHGRFFSQYVYFLNGSSSISWMEARLFWLEKSVWLKLLMAWLWHEDPSRPQAGCVIKHNDWVIFHVFLSSSSKPGFYSSVIDWLIVWLMLW